MFDHSEVRLISPPKYYYN